MDIQLREEVRAVRCMTQQVWRRLSPSKFQLWRDFYIDDTNIFFFHINPSVSQWLYSLLVQTMFTIFLISLLAIQQFLK